MQATEYRHMGLTGDTAREYRADLGALLAAPRGTTSELGRKKENVMKAKITRRTVIRWHYTTDPATMGYGTDEERAEADRRFEASTPDAVGTIATLPERIREEIRSGGLSGGTYYRQELRIRDGQIWRPATRDEIDALDALAEGLIVSPYAGKRQGL